MLEGVTGVVVQPFKGAQLVDQQPYIVKLTFTYIGAKREGIWGLVKGTGKGMLGLVLRPTGGIIDLTSATFNAVQRCVWCRTSIIIYLGEHYSR